MASVVIGPRCAGPERERDELTFAVLDVGQGLSQAAVRNGKALMFDMGPQGQAERWHDGYQRLGLPQLRAAVISHSDSDHVSGLASLDTSVDFSGLLYISPFEDTARIMRYAGPWHSRLVFRRIACGDTVGGLEGVRVECLWPPSGIQSLTPLSTEERNRYSLVILLSHGECRALMTADVDTVALDSLTRRHGWALRAQLLVAPHHGSLSGLHRSFYGYVSPTAVLISCGVSNPYGHPAPRVVDLIFEMGCELRTTAQYGHLMSISQGYYWSWE